MKNMILFSLMLTFFLSSCGKNNSGGGSSTSLSSDPLHASTIDGYLVNNGSGTLEMNGQTYQMISNLSYSQINQQLQTFLMSGGQPTFANGIQKFRAHITGYLYNPCQQNMGFGGYNTGYTGYNTGYNTGCTTTSSNLFNVTNIQFF